MAGKKKTNKPQKKAASKPKAKKQPVQKASPAASTPIAKPTPQPQPQQQGQFIIFPTVCFQRQHQGAEIDKMNAELKNEILRIEKEQQSMTKSSIRGGHHSDRKIFERNNWAIQALKSLIISDFSVYIRKFWERESITPLASFGKIDLHIGGWSMIMREGDMSVPHLHPRANISGTYYVSIPQSTKNKDDKDGNLVLQDPRSRAPVFPITGQSLNIRVIPRTGSIIMFPSYIEHYVTPFKGTGERISVAFNIHLPAKMGGMAKTTA